MSTTYDVANYSDLIFRLRERARVRRSIPTRKCVLLGQEDRLAALLDEAAQAIEDATIGREEAANDV